MTNLGDRRGAGGLPDKPASSGMVEMTRRGDMRGNIGRTNPRPAAVDLFCGAGGLSYGMQMAGIDIAAGIDVDSNCRYPFETNVGARFHEKDIAGLDMSFVESLFPKDRTRILAGCAPCQPFSSYVNGNNQKVEGTDGRWHLLSKFGEAVSRILPEIVTMENVPGIRRHRVFQDFLDVLDESGYSKSHVVVKCEEYGVPQTRRRLVLLASRLGNIDLVPHTHDNGKYGTVESAIGRMKCINAGSASNSDPLHKSSGLSARNLKRMRASSPGGTWRDWKRDLRAPCHDRPTGVTYHGVYGRMAWNKPAPTVTTQFHGFGSGRFGHPEQDRAISLREGALLQTFPRDYAFVPPDEPVFIKPIARMIGNAVPVKIGEAIGRSIVAHLVSKNAGD